MSSLPASQPRIVWRTATVVELIRETKTTCTVTLDVPGWPGHQAGQHVDVRLTAEDGYQAERSYSIASPPESPKLALTIERLEDGEVSPYLAGELRPGDSLELRGPIGGYFVWHARLAGPLMLIGGGSGIVPLMAMLRHRALAQEHRATADWRARLLYSSRTWDDIIYRDEIARLGASDPTLGVAHTLTRGTPAQWSGYSRRIDQPMLGEFGWSPVERPRIFVCGPTPMVEAVANALVELGHEPAMIKTERFGPTG